METININDPLFKNAVNALDEGRLDGLQKLINDHPDLVRYRLSTPGKEGYFKDPYLIWFVADNPIRIPKLPANIIDVTRFLIGAVERYASDTYQLQIDYTLELVATGRIPRECGVQIAIMDALLDAGAATGSAMGAIANSNLEAANHLIDRGAELTLASALLLDRNADIDSLINSSDSEEKLLALTAAAFYGKADNVKYLLNRGVEANGYPQAGSGFHSHTTPLHQAVYSKSLDTVKLLVNAGANLDARDKIFDGTPLGWAEYLKRDATNQKDQAAYAEIEEYLQEK
jgi:hypothetical protein